MTTIGLFGYGQFGQLLAQHLQPHVREIRIYDPQYAQSDTLERTAQADVLIFAVPIQALETLLQQTQDHIQPNSWVLDVCSIKLPAIKLLEEYVPPHAHILGTHPLFGPQSGKDGIENLPLILCPVRGDHHPILTFTKDVLGLKVIVSTAEEHDKEMAYVQALTHLIGRSLKNLDIPDTPIQTRSYKHLLELRDLLKNDTFELFTAIQTENPFAEEVTGCFKKEIESLLSRVRG